MAVTQIETLSYRHDRRGGHSPPLSKDVLPSEICRDDSMEPRGSARLAGGGVLAALRQGRVQVSGGADAPMGRKRLNCPIF